MSKNKDDKIEEKQPEVLQDSDAAVEVKNNKAEAKKMTSVYIDSKHAEATHRKGGNIVTVTINGTKHEVPCDQQVEVPVEVAEVLQNAGKGHPTH